MGVILRPLKPSSRTQVDFAEGVVFGGADGGEGDVFLGLFLEECGDGVVVGEEAGEWGAEAEDDDAVGGGHALDVGVGGEVPVALFAAGDFEFGEEFGGHFGGLPDVGVRVDDNVGLA